MAKFHELACADKWIRAALYAAGLAGLLALSGCAGSSAPPVGALQSDLGCVDDSARCISARRRALDALLADQNRAWIAQQPSAATHASGVRLFALKTQKSKLTCDQLARGVTEAGSAPAILRGPQGAGLTPAQISRSVMLADEVGLDLKREQRRRCRKSG